MRPLFSLCLFGSTLLALPYPAHAQDLSPEQAAASITASDIVERIALLADDSMRGRLTPSPELDQVAAWIGSQFAEYGLEPGAEGGSFIQRYPIHRVRLDRARSGIRFTSGPQWQFGRDLLRFVGNTRPVGRSGSLLVAGGHLEQLDAMVDLPVADRTVLWIVPTDRRGTPALRTVNELATRLLSSDAAAIVLVMDRGENQWRAGERALDRVRTIPGWHGAETTPLLEVRPRAAIDVLAPLGIDVTDWAGGAFRYRVIESLDAHVTVTDEIVDEEMGPNVVGVLPGSDPILRDEYVVFSAHMDHVGTSETSFQCRAVGGDTICNGADDDASGTSTLIDVAEAFAALAVRPKRSLVFLIVSGEEQGLWGSEFFAANPTVNLDRIVANLNADMVGRNAEDSIVVIGKEHSDLGQILDDVVAAHPELGLTAADDIWPEERFYFRSDHFNFARRGVPILFFFNGVHDEYHRPGDEVDLIDGSKAMRVGRLLFHLATEIANRPQRPSWDPESYAEIVGSR